MSPLRYRIKHKTKIGRRTFKRIHLRIKFQVSGRDEQGCQFVSHAETLNVCSEGGCLTLDRDVRQGDNLKLYSPKGILFLAKVCWSSYDIEENIRYVGFKLAEAKTRWVLVDARKEYRHGDITSGWTL